MIICRSFVLSAAALAATTMVSHAGPCTQLIDGMQVRVDSWLEAKAAQGLMGPETTGALLHRQPTPRSIEAAEMKLRELSAQTVEALTAAMARARAADDAGDLSLCEQALAEVEGLIGR